MASKILFVGKGKLSSQVHLDLMKNLPDGNFLADVLKRTAIDEAEIRACYVGDVANKESWSQLDDDYDVVLYCVTPNGRTEEAYKQVFLEGMKNCLSHFHHSKSHPFIVFVSSTSVYAQSQGEMVDETCEASGLSETSRVLCATESTLMASMKNYCVVRLSGIYGGTRNRMLNQLKLNEPVLSDAVRVSNRIHEDDASGFLSYVIQMYLAGKHVEPLYVATDSMPVELNEVYRYLASEMKLVINPKVSDGKSRRSGNKYLSNKKMLSTGFKLKYPSYKDGYSEMLARTPI